jgi:hypothetical protein
MAEVSGIAVKFQADISDLSAKMDIISAQMTKVKTTSGDMAKGVVLGQAAFQMLSQAAEEVKGFLEEAVSKAEEMTKTQALLNAVIASTKGASGETAQSINDLNEQLEKTNGINKEVITSGSDVLLKYTSIGKDIFPQASQAMLDMATAMNHGVRPSQDDLSSSAKILGMALSSPATGYSRLKRAGVDFSATQIQQIKDFVKVGDTAKAQGIIIDQMGKTFGNAAAATKTPMDDMNNSVIALKEEIGSALLPTIQIWEAEIAKLVSGITTFISNHSQAILEIAKLVAVAGSAILVIIGLEKAFGILQIAIKAFSATLEISPWGIAMIAAAALAAGIMYLSDKFGGLGNAMKVVGLALEEVGEACVLGLEKLGNFIINWINDKLAIANKMYNEVSDILKKFGGSGDHIDLKINPIDTTGTENAISGIQKKIDDLKVSAKKGVVAPITSLSGGITPETGNGATAAAISKMKDEINSFAKGLDDAVQKHKDAMDKINTDTINAKKDFDQQNADAAESYNDSMADIVKSHEDKEASIKKQLMEATAFGQNIDESKVADLQNQLATEQAFLTKHAGVVASVQSEMNKDEIDKATDKFNEEKTKRLTDYNNKLADLKTQLDKENDAYNKSFGQMGIDFKGNWDDILNWVKTQATPNMVAAFKDMVAQTNIETAKLGLGKTVSMPSLSSGISKSKVSGGASHKISNTININNPVVRNSNDIKEIGKVIDKHLMNVNQLAIKGAY